MANVPEPKSPEELAQAIFRARPRKRVSIRARIATAICAAVAGLVTTRMIMDLAQAEALSAVVGWFWGYLLVALVLCVVSGAGCVVLARKRGWDTWVWGVNGVIFAPLSLAIALVKASEPESCEESRV